MLFFSYYLLCYVTVTFGTYLTLAGYEQSVITSLIVMDGIITICLRPFIGRIIDKGYSKVLACILLALISIGVAIFFFNEKSLLNAVLFTILFRNCCFNLSDVVDSWVLKLAKADSSIDYAKARSFGSIAFCCISLVFGLIIDNFGLQSCPVIIYPIIAIFFFVMINMEKSPVEQTKKYDFRESLSLFTDKKFLLFTIFYTLTLSIINFTDNYAGVILLDKGGSSLHIGLYDCLRTVIEFIVMLNFSKFASKYGCYGVMIIGSFGFFAKCLSISLAPTAALGVATCIFQAVSFPFFEPGKMLFLKENMPQNSMAVALSLIGSISSIFTTVILDPTVSLLTSKIGISNVGIVVSILPIISAIGFISINKKKQEQ